VDARLPIRRTSSGRTIKICTFDEEYTCESLADIAAYPIDADATFSTLDKVVADRARRAPIRCDDGPSLTGNALGDWSRFSRASAGHIEPASPWQNPWVESYGSRMRDELLARSRSSTLSPKLHNYRPQGSGHAHSRRVLYR
jgi:hypothetical protein